MPLDTMAVLLALGLLAAYLAGAGPRRRDILRTTPDDGPLGLGAGRTTRCPLCAQPALELVGLSVRGGQPVPQVRCGSCLNSYAVHGTLFELPTQRRPVP